MAERRCPQCGSRSFNETVHGNRSGPDRNTAYCRDCGWGGREIELETCGEHSDGFTRMVAELVKAYPNVSRVEQTVRIGPDGQSEIVCAVEFDHDGWVTQEAVPPRPDPAAHDPNTVTLTGDEPPPIPPFPVGYTVHEYGKPKFREFT